MSGYPYRRTTASPQTVSDSTRWVAGELAQIERALVVMLADIGVHFGAGSPEAVVTAAVGAIYRRTDGGAGTTLYVKESGTGNTGWIGK